MIRRVSKKRSAVNRKTKPARDEYRAEFWLCQWCNASQANDLHEISRGAGRNASLSERAAWLHLCSDCHRQMNWLPVAGQLAIKRLTDFEFYDRVKVNTLRGRAPESITESEVDLWVRRFGLGAA